MTASTISLAAEGDTAIDAGTAFAHINWDDSWRTRRLGVRNRAFSNESGYIQFDIKITRVLRVIVKLMADDTYAVEIGRIRKMEYVVIEQMRGIYGDVLGQTVEALCIKWSEASAKALASR